MRDAYADFERTGVRLVVVGNGQPFQAAAFRIEQAIPFDLWVDPDMEAYRAAGLRRGVASTFSPRAIANGLRAFRAGHRQTSVQGDPWQQGGAFLFTRDGATRYAQVSTEAGDHAPIPELLAAAEAVSADGLG